MRDIIQSLAGGNKIAFILLAILLVNVAYPISELGTGAALLFISFYLVLTGSAIYLVSSNRRLLIIATVLTVTIAVTGGITVTSGFNEPLWELAWNASLFM